jgi:tRNA dimethylallyltransferase
LKPYPHTVYVIAGPTAVGKTAIAIELARRLGTSIISADSRQCYREMTIGTAKPTEGELAQAHHYFINSHSVTEHLTTADFERLALSYLEDIFKTSDKAVVCGGTGLYIKSLCEGIDEMPDVDVAIEREVNEQYQQHGIEWLQSAIQQEDPEFYQQGEIQNPVRMIRALSFVRSTGNSILNYRTGAKMVRPFNIIKIALELPREVLYERINRRVDIMMEQGLLEEVKQLYPQRHLKNLQTVGYSELFDYIDGKYTLDEAIDKIKQHTRNYAKRQLTWFRKDKEFHWLEAGKDNIIDRILAVS